MTNDERAELGKYLIDLIGQQEETTRKWIEFLIAIEAGLVVALGFLLQPGEVAGEQVALPRGALTLVPVAGAVVGVVLTVLAVLTQGWQGWYVARFNELGFEGKVFPSGRGNVTKSPVSQPMDAYTIMIVVLGFLVLAFWVAVYILVVRPAC